MKSFAVKNKNNRIYEFCLTTLEYTYNLLNNRDRSSYQVAPALHKASCREPHVQSVNFAIKCIKSSINTGNKMLVDKNNKCTT